MYRTVRNFFLCVHLLCMQEFKKNFSISNKALINNASIKAKEHGMI